MCSSDLGSMRLRIVDATGAPRAGLTFCLGADLASAEWITEKTGADGRITLAGAPGMLAIWTWPRRFLDQEALRAAAADHAGEKDWWRTQLVRIGEVTLTAGAESERELRLPPEWDR